MPFYDLRDEIESMRLPALFALFPFWASGCLNPIIFSLFTVHTKVIFCELTNENESMHYPSPPPPRKVCPFLTKTCCVNAIFFLIKTPVFFVFVGNENDCLMLWMRNVKVSCKQVSSMLQIIKGRLADMSNIAESRLYHHLLALCSCGSTIYNRPINDGKKEATASLHEIIQINHFTLVLQSRQAKPRLGQGLISIRLTINCNFHQV